MPNKIKSKRQYRMVQAIEHGWRPPPSSGITMSQGVAKEMMSTQSKPYSKLPEKKRKK